MNTAAGTCIGARRRISFSVSFTSWPEPSVTPVTLPARSAPPLPCSNPAPTPCSARSLLDASAREGGEGVAQPSADVADQDSRLRRLAPRCRRARQHRRPVHREFRDRRARDVCPCPQGRARRRRIQGVRQRVPGRPQQYLGQENLCPARDAHHRRSASMRASGTARISVVARRGSGFCRQGRPRL